MKTYSDFVVSCGDSLSPVNVFMSKENNAKNIVIMRPSMVMGFKKFNLAIIPKHDRPPNIKNIVKTAIAPNLIDEETLKNSGQILKRHVNITKSRVIGLFVGGDNDEFLVTKEIIKQVIDQLLEFCASHKAELLVTTSRRTPSRIEGLLKERLKHNPVCKLLIVANEKNMDGAVSGILSLSDIAVVSEESISMI